VTGSDRQMEHGSSTVQALLLSRSRIAIV
jgi:hypothetical protein